MKLYTTKTVAEWLDLTESRVRQLRKDKIITERQPGLYELKTVTHEYINYLRKGSPTEASVDYNTERAKLVRAKRESQELELSLRKNCLLYTSRDRTRRGRTRRTSRAAGEASRTRRG